MWHIFSRFLFWCLFILWLSLRFSYQQIKKIHIIFNLLTIFVCLMKTPFEFLCLYIRLKTFCLTLGGEKFSISVSILFVFSLWHFSVAFFVSIYFSYCKNLLKSMKIVRIKHVRYKIKSYILKLTGKVCCLFMEIAK